MTTVGANTLPRALVSRAVPFRTIRSSSGKTTPASGLFKSISAEMSAVSTEKLVPKKMHSLRQFTHIPGNSKSSPAVSESLHMYKVKNWQGTNRALAKMFNKR